MTLSIYAYIIIYIIEWFVYNLYIYIQYRNQTLKSFSYIKSRNVLSDWQSTPLPLFWIIPVSREIVLLSIILVKAITAWGNHSPLDRLCIFLDRRKLKRINKKISLTIMQAKDPDEKTVKEAEFIKNRLKNLERLQ